VHGGGGNWKPQRKADIDGDPRSSAAKFTESLISIRKKADLALPLKKEEHGGNKRAIRGSVGDRVHRGGNPRKRKARRNNVEAI